MSTWLLLGTSRVWEVPPAPEEAAAGTAKPVPSWEFHSLELDQALVEVNGERERLRLLARDLSDWEERLRLEWQEIGAVTQAMARLQADLDKTIVVVRQEEMANLKRLARTYANMKPDAAARILGELRDDEIVRILVMMKDAEFGAILEGFSKQEGADLKRIARLSYRLRSTTTRTP